jgi:hypothetical protein
MSSTRKTSRNLRWAKDSLTGAVAAVADAAAAAAAGGVVQAAEPAAAAESRGVGPGVVATPVRPRRYGDVNRPGRLDPLGQRQCGKLRSRKRRAVAPLRFAVMSVDPIKKCWRENRSTPAPGFDEIPNNTITIIAATPHYAGRGNVNGPAPRPGIHKPG